MRVQNAAGRRSDHSITRIPSSSIGASAVRQEGAGRADHQLLAVLVLQPYLEAAMRAGVTGRGGRQLTARDDGVSGPGRLDEAHRDLAAGDVALAQGADQHLVQISNELAPLHDGAAKPELLACGVVAMEVPGAGVARHLRHADVLADLLQLHLVPSSVLDGKSCGSTSWVRRSST